MPPGLNTIDDGSSLLAALAPPRPVTRASCSLMLNAFADATPASAPRPSAVNNAVRRVFMVVAYRLRTRKVMASVCRRTVPSWPAAPDDGVGRSSDAWSKVLPGNAGAAGGSVGYFTNTDAVPIAAEGGGV